MRATARAVRLLMLRRIKHQPLRAGIAALTIGAGVSLAVAILVVIGSATASIEETGRELAGITELRVIGATSRGGLDPAVVERIEATDGVEGVVPMVQAVTLVAARPPADPTRPVLVLGVDCRVELLVGPVGCTPETLAALTGPPFLSSTLQREVGADAILRTDAGRIDLDGAPVLTALDDLAGGRVVVFPLARAQELFGRPDRLDVAYVETVPGADLDALQQQLEAVVGPHNGVLRAADEPPGVSAAIARVVPLFSLVAMIALGIGGVLVHNTVTLSMEERRRQLAIVGALGGTNRLVVGGTLAEAAVLGLAGGAVGAIGGALIARPITASLSNFTSKAVGIPLTVHVTPSVVVIALVLGALVSVGAAIRPARRAQRYDVAAELSGRAEAQEARPRSLVVRTIVWSLVAAAGIGLCGLVRRDGGLEPWQAALSPVALVVVVIGMMLLTASLTPLALSRAEPLVGRRPAALRLAFASISRDAGRTGVMAVAVGSASAVAFITASFDVAIRESVTDNLTRNVRGVMITTLDPSELGSLEAQMPAAVADRVDDLPGVAEVSRGASILVGHRGTELVQVSGFDRIFLEGFTVVDGRIDAAGFQSGEVVIGPGLARDEGLRAGDMASLPTPTGTVEVPVQAVVLNGDLGGRNVTMSYELLTKIYGEQPLTGLIAEPTDGTTAEALAETVRAAKLDPDAQVDTAAVRADEISDAVSSQLAPFWALQRGLLVLAFVAVLSTLLLVGLQHQREIGLLGAVGMRPSELAGMVVAEAAVVAVAAVVIGTIFSVAMYIGLMLVAPVVIGFDSAFVVNEGAALLWAAVGVVVAVLGSLWPAWRTSRTDILDALRYE